MKERKAKMDEWFACIFFVLILIILLMLPC